MAATTPHLDLGKLLRVRAMVTGAAQVDVTYEAGGALVRAYLSLREEMILALEPEPLAALREEFQRLFPGMEIPPPHNPRSDMRLRSVALLSEAAAEAQLNLRRLEGWVQGLIDELTLDQRLRMEAEEKAKLESKLKPGFQGG